MMIANIKHLYRIDSTNLSLRGFSGLAGNFCRDPGPITGQEVKEGSGGAREATSPGEGARMEEGPYNPRNRTEAESNTKGQT